MQLGRLHTGSGKIIISPTAIEKYYNDHPDDFKVEDQVKLRMIQLPESARQPARRRQTNGRRNPAKN